MSSDDVPPAPTAATLRRILGLLRPYPLRTALALGLGVPLVVLATAQPLVLRHIIDDGLVAASPDALTGGALLLGLLAAVQFGCSSWRRQVGGTLALDLQNDLRRRLGRQLLALDASWHDRSRTGRVLSSVGADVDAIRSFLGFGFVFIVIDGLTVLVTLVQMWLLSPTLTLLAMVVVLPVLPLTALYSARLGAVLRRMHARRAELVTVVHETSAGFVAVRSGGAAESRRQAFAEHAELLRADGVAAARLRARFGPLIAALPRLAGVGLVWFGGTAVIAGELTLGTVLAFHAYLAILAVPIAASSQLTSSAQRAVVGGQRVFAVLDARPSLRDRPDAIELTPSGGGAAVELRDVGFRSLRGLRARIEPGEQVAVLGATASGKSTLAALLTREYDPDSGCLLVDGVDLRSLTVRSVRRAVLCVPPDAFVFAGTVRENLTLGAGPTPDGELRRVLDGVQLLDFVDGLPLRLDQPVGERGYDLSGGQRQRLALARAVLHRPRVLVLDGALSEVDAHTEGRIRARLPDLLGSTTVLHLGADRARGETDRVLWLESMQWAPA